MSIIKKLRAYHAALVVSAILAYLTGELGIVHSYIGYGVAIIIVFRLLLALSGERQLGLMKFYPQFEGLNLNNAFTHPAISKTFLLSIAVSLILTTITGIIIDSNDANGVVKNSIVTSAYADDDDGEKGEGEDSILGELHEMLASLTMLSAAMHATYVFLFKRPLAKFMLFMDKKKSA